MNKYLEIIHRENIYENFYILPFQTEENNISPYLDNIFKDFSCHNATIIEVGSWKGSSAISICNYLKSKNIKPTIFCVDTWSGATYHREHQQFFEMLKCKNGFPTLYQQFLSNIIHSGLQDNVIPIPHSSHDAARYLKKLNIQADFCYIDACHEYDEVLDDIKSYWDLVKSNGVIFGDDYDNGWPGVVGAVNEFISGKDLRSRSSLFNSTWTIKKS